VPRKSWQCLPSRHSTRHEFPGAGGYDAGMTLEEAKEAASRMAAGRGVSLGPLLWSAPGVEPGAWGMAFEATDDPPGWAWHFLITGEVERDIMVVAPPDPPALLPRDERAYLSWTEVSKPRLICLMQRVHWAGGLTARPMAPKTSKPTINATIAVISRSRREEKRIAMPPSTAAE